jgi:hypothetical protein
MPILVNCTVCGHRRYVPEEDIPLGVRCPKCDETFMDPIVPKIGEPGARVRRRVPHPRHSATTIGLVVVVAAAALAAVTCLTLAVISMAQIGPMESLFPWLLAAQGVLCVLDGVCGVALLRYKKWGFHGLVAGLGLAFLVTLISGAVVTAGLLLLGELIALGALYALLGLGTPSTWSQLE